MKRFGSGAAVAAALLVILATLWHLNEPKTLFAQVVRAMSRAKGFRCDLIEISPDTPVPRTPSSLATSSGPQAARNGWTSSKRTSSPNPP